MSQRDEVRTVMVVGAGVAGLAAALEVARAGVEVTIVDRHGTIGGASYISGGASLVVDSPLQRSAGIADSLELALSDWAAWGGDTVDLAWARMYVERSLADVYGWCEALGVRWIGVEVEEGNSVPRLHYADGGGAAMVGAIQTEALRLGVSIETGVALRELAEVDGEVVVGLEEAGAAPPTSRRVGAVILATGGFVSNVEMLRHHAPALVAARRVLSGGAARAQGSGHAVLESIGARFVCMDSLCVYPIGTPDPEDPAQTRGLSVRGIASEVWLNEDGRRFHNEDLRGSQSGTAALLDQPGQHAWGVFDAAERRSAILLSNLFYGLPTVPNEARVDQFFRDPRAHVWVGDSIGELAERAELPPSNVQQAVASYNRDVAAVVARDAFGRDLREARQIATPPFFAVEYMPLVAKNLGGVATDLACRVMGSAGPFTRIFAAGEVAGMAGGHINGAAGLEGTMFGPCLMSGVVAGREAAALLRSA